jgi:hypothetical protein
MYVIVLLTKILLLLLIIMSYLCRNLYIYINMILLIHKILSFFVTPLMSYIYIFLFRFVVKTHLTSSVNGSCSVKFIVLEGNMFWPVALIAMISKVLNFFNIYGDHTQIFESVQNDLISSIVFIMLGIIVYILWNKLNNNDSSTKAETKTSVPATTGGTRGEDSEEDDEKPKSRWEKLKQFYFDHQQEIHTIVFGILAVTLFVYLPKKDDNNNPPNLKENPPPTQQSIAEKVPAAVNFSQEECDCYIKVRSFYENILNNKLRDPDDMVDSIYVRKNGISFEENRVFHRTARNIKSTINRYITTKDRNSEFPITDTEYAQLKQWKENISLDDDIILNAEAGKSSWNQVIEAIDRIDGVLYPLGLLQANVLLEAQIIDYKNRVTN